MQTLVAVKQFRYRSRTIYVGDEITADSELDEKIIIHIGNAMVKVAADTPRRTYNRRDLRAKP